MKCKLYDITNNDIIGYGKIIRIESTIKDMYYNAYRMVRKAYNRKKELDLLIVSSNSKSVMILSSIPNIGLMMTTNAKTTWAKENI